MRQTLTTARIDQDDGTVSLAAARDARLRAVTEKELVQRIKRTARRFNWIAYHTLNSKGSDPGFPDLVLIRAPRLVFAEVKTETGRATKEQMDWMQQLRAIDHDGIEIYLWRPRDWDRILEILR